MIRVRRDQAERLAGWVNMNAQLYDVRVGRLITEASDPLLAGVLSVETTVATSTTADLESVEVRAAYELEARVSQANDGPPVDEAKIAWSVEVELVASFITNPQVERFTDSQLAAFGRTTGLMAIHPFARELVHNLTARLGYPPFTMEFLRGGDVAGDEELELDADEFDDSQILRDPEPEDDEP